MGINTLCRWCGESATPEGPHDCKAVIKIRVPIGKTLEEVTLQKLPIRIDGTAFEVRVMESFSGLMEFQLVRKRRTCKARRS